MRCEGALHQASLEQMAPLSCLLWLSWSLCRLPISGKRTAVACGQTWGWKASLLLSFDGWIALYPSILFQLILECTKLFGFYVHKACYIHTHATR
jgi:hypothetical protein